jgi:hypothetical protein
MQRDRVKEAVRRDWQQTTHDLHIGGHQLSPHVGNTIKHASGAEDIPSTSGYMARDQFGSTPLRRTIPLHGCRSSAFAPANR